MHMIKMGSIALTIALLSGFGAQASASQWSATPAHMSGMDAAAFATNDPAGNFFPGKYFQYKAQFYLSKRDYGEALRLFELAGFWANKIAQYNAGLMYYNGIGLPVDRIRGVAWLGIAAEAHDDLAMRALQVAYASLGEDEKRRAGELFKQLDEKYGDAVALPRALRRFEQEKLKATGSHLGHPVGYSTVYVTGAGGNGSSGEEGSTYYGHLDKDRDELMARITGRVTVGAVEALKVPEEARRNASQVPLIEPSVK